MSDLAKRLRIKAGMIEMGERIAWGSDSALMREAADALEATERGAREDYKLVPVEPTAEMMATGGIEMGARDEDARAVWKAMIAAAPDVQGEPVGWKIPGVDRLFTSRAEAELSRLTGQCAVPLYASPQPAEHQPDRDVRMLAASLYQACGAYDMPTRVLDVLSAAANGEPFAHMIDGLLPCVPPSNQDVQGDPVGAEQQPCPEAVREGAPYDDPAFESLCREYGIWGTPAAAQCAVFWEAGKRVAEQQPAPDVPGLTKALRQYQHNDGRGLVFGYDKLLVDQYVVGLVEALEQGFPLLSDEGLDEVEHHCEWVIQRERKRVHSILADYRKQGGEA